MAPKKHARPVLRTRNFFWMALALLLVGLIWRRLLDCLTFVEGLYAPGQYIDVAAYIALITSNMPVDWYTETLLLLCQVSGLAFLLHVCLPGKEGSKRKSFLKPDIFPWRRGNSGDARQERREPEETQKRFRSHAC